MIFTWLFLKTHYPIPIVLSFIPVFVGTLVSTYYDLQFNIIGVLCRKFMNRSVLLFLTYTF